MHQAKNSSSYTKWLLLLSVLCLVYVLDIGPSLPIRTDGLSHRSLSSADDKDSTHHLSGSNIRENRIPGAPEDFDILSLRILAFGTSRTWGAGLPNRLKQAFPYLLNENATNLAIRAAGPEYPSLCTSSMIEDAAGAANKDAAYDVILLEYNLQANSHLIQLAERLRHRYPNSIIIFVHLWLPFQFTHVPSKTGLKQLLKKEKAAARHPPSKRHLLGRVAAAASDSSTVRRLVKDSSPTDWKFLSHDEAQSYVEKAASSVGAYTIQLEQPQRDPKQVLLNRLELFQSDLSHYSVAGHRFVSERVLEILGHARVWETTGELSLLQPWDTIDRCNLWYLKPEIWNRSNHSSNLLLVEFSRGKYAVPIPASHDSETDSWIEVVNPMNDTVSHVYVNYMASGDPQVYPLVRAMLEERRDLRNNRAVVSPVDTKYPKTYPVHLLQTTRVGTLQPLARRKLRLRPLEDTTQSEFRVVGTIVTGMDPV